MYAKFTNVSIPDSFQLFGDLVTVGGLVHEHAMPLAARLCAFMLLLKVIKLRESTA